MSQVFLNDHISYRKCLNKILDVMAVQMIKYVQNGSGCAYFIMRAGHARNRCHKENLSDQGVDH